MKKLTPTDPETKSADSVAENIARLCDLFPEAFTEGRVNFEVLKQLLGDEIDDRDEKYGLNWHGKRRARQIALTPSTGTLRPAPEESVDWATTQNLMIEGDNLEVLKLLQKSYAGKVKLIYIDPPYNTGNDFVYPDDFSDNIQNYQMLTGQIDTDGRSLTSQGEASGRFHTQWLNMIYPRLRLARNLMGSDGVICISIDDNEEANLRKVCDDIFGEENHIATIVWQKRYVSNVTAKWLSDMHDFVLVYAKNRELVKVNSWERTEEQLEAYKNPDKDPRGDWRAQDLSASKPYSAGQYSIEGPTGLTFDPPPNRYWRCNREQFDKWCGENRIWWGVNKDARPMLKAFISESERGITPHTWWDHEFAGHNKEATLELKELFAGDAPFDTPKPVRLMRRLLDLFCDKNEIVLDFFCGSAPIAQAVLESNAAKMTGHRFVMVQFPEPSGRDDFPTIFKIASERVRRAGKVVREKSPLFQGDFGFRVFRLDSSNIRAWDPQAAAADLSGSLLANIEHLKPDRSEQDVLYELLLKLGLDLTVPIATRKVGAGSGVEVHAVGAGALMVCLGTRIGRGEVEALAEGIAAWHAELAPVGETTLVFRDSGFEDDVAKANLTAILAQRGFDENRIRSL